MYLKRPPRHATAAALRSAISAVLRRRARPSLRRHAQALAAQRVAGSASLGVTERIKGDLEHILVFIWCDLEHY
jgi:hypothetical protein